jgi:hypothetical protein
LNVEEDPVSQSSKFIAQRLDSIAICARITQEYIVESGEHVLVLDQPFELL